MTHRLKRRAKEHLHKPPKFWRTVIFSDENKYCIFCIKDRKLIWRNPCQELQKEHLVPTINHGGSGVMVWGEQRCRQVGVDRIIMNKYDYLDVLKNNLKKSTPKLDLGSSFRCQHELS
ncbi:hypothetical protein TNCV_3893081 [Trichonephila clavipes]|nr:hypothetical protein TNCV_3893081 [Trichonephila clavipes]